MTPVQGRRWKRDLMKQLERDHRRKQREDLRTLRHQIRDARERRRASVVRAKELCREAKLAARQRSRELRARMLEELRAAVQKERDEARATCATCRQDAGHAKTELEQRRQALKAEREYQRSLRRIEAGSRQRHRELAKTHARVRRTESDDEVRGNIPPELVPLFERVKGKIRGSDRWSRTEAFLHYAEEHPNEILEVLEDKTDTLVAELEQRERAGRRALKRAVPREVYADVVPF